MKKYVVVSHKYGNTLRGAYTTALSLAKEFPEFIDFKEEREVKSLEHLGEQYEKVILLTQMPSKYPFDVNVINLQEVNHAIFIREEFNHFTYDSYTNGFHYYKEHPSIKNYVPILSRMPDIEVKQRNRPCYGFYVRHWLTPDSYWMFCKVLHDLKERVDVYVIGNQAPGLERFEMVKNYKHTYSNIEFFENITHYVYPTSKRFVDPFPNTLYEAVQYDKEIIIPQQERDFKDGINDIMDVIYTSGYETLKWKNFKNFYYRLLENEFVYKFDRMCYDSFNKWIENEVL